MLSNRCTGTTSSVGTLGRMFKLWRRRKGSLESHDISSFVSGRMIGMSKTRVIHGAVRSAV